MNEEENRGGVDSKIVRSQTIQIFKSKQDYFKNIFDQIRELSDPRI